MSLISPVSEVNDVYVFGDSHWRVFFPFVNHGDASANVSHTGEYCRIKVRTIDTIANELSGSTMWGLLNDKSRHGARSRILNTLKSIGSVENVALVFGEVDARYHNERYFDGEQLILSRVLELVSRYAKFIQEDLILPGLVRRNVFVYHGFAYPKGENTLLQPGQPIGKNYVKANKLNEVVKNLLPKCLTAIDEVTVITPSFNIKNFVSEDGVHLDPKMTYENITLPVMCTTLGDEEWKIPF